MERDYSTYTNLTHNRMEHSYSYGTTIVRITVVKRTRTVIRVQWYPLVTGLRYLRYDNGDVQTGTNNIYRNHDKTNNYSRKLFQNLSHS